MSVVEAAGGRLAEFFCEWSSPTGQSVQPSPRIHADGASSDTNCCERGKKVSRKFDGSMPVLWPLFGLCPSIWFISSSLVSAFPPTISSWWAAELTHEYDKSELQPLWWRSSKYLWQRHTSTVLRIYSTASCFCMRWQLLLPRKRWGLIHNMSLNSARKQVSLAGNVLSSFIIFFLLPKLVSLSQTRTLKRMLWFNGEKYPNFPKPTRTKICRFKRYINEGWWKL